MPIYTNDPCDDGLFPVEPSLRSSIGIGPKVTKAIDAATKDWLDKHPEATTTVEDYSLTNEKFMDGSVNSRVIEDESITTDDIHDLAVTTPKIADVAVTTPKIADDAVTADKITSSAADGLRVMSVAQVGVAKVGAGLAMNGDVLELDGSGDIATAVSTWLDAHPDATTTVQPHSVSPYDLTNDVVDSILFDTPHESRKYSKLNLLRRGIAQSTGNLSTATNRAVTGIYDMNEGDYFELADGFEGWVGYYDYNTKLTDDKYFTWRNWSYGDHGWQSHVIPVERTGPCALVIHRTDDDNISFDFLSENYGKIVSIVRNSEEGIVSGGYHFYVMGHLTSDNHWGDNIIKTGGLYAWNLPASYTSLLPPRYWSTMPIEIQSGIDYHVDDEYVMNVFRLSNDDEVITEIQCERFNTDENFRGIIDLRPKDNNLMYYDFDPSVFHADKIDAFDSAEWRSLPIGQLVQGGINVEGSIADRTDRLTMPYEAAFSISGPIDIRVSLATGYKLGIRTGINSSNISSNQYWFTNGDIINIPEGHNYYRVAIAKPFGIVYKNYAINVPISEDDSADVMLALWYKPSNDVQIGAQDDLVNASRMAFGRSVNSSLNSFPVIAHTSDCHGDYTRVKRFLDYCDVEKVDLAAITGDIVPYNMSQGIGWFHELVNGHKSLVGVCTGNHDVMGATGTDDDTYSFLYEPIAETIGNETGKTWYSTDIAIKSLRVISINLYQREGTTNNHTHFTEEQLSWLCSTLASTPAGYGVVLLYHSPQRKMSTASEGYEKFFQTLRKYNNTYNDVQGSPINDIVDAFISRGSINKTYDQAGTPTTISVAQDFSGVANGVEFIAHLTGHFHQDSIAYVTGTEQMQLMLNVTCTNSLYGGTVYPYLCDLVDLPRNQADVTQDAFNIYVIRRDTKTIKVARVGSDMTFDMQKRDYMEIPYAE